MSEVDKKRAALQELLSRANGRALNLIFVFARSLLEKQKAASAANTDDLGV